MLAASAGRRLTIIDPSTFKYSSAPPSPSKQTALDVEFSSLTWNHDNTALFVAADGTIRKYDSSGHFNKILHTANDKICHMTIKDASELIYTKGKEVCIVDCLTGDVVESIEVHDMDIKAISLSNDSSLLAVASASKCIVYDLNEAPAACLSTFDTESDSSFTACVFHTHTRSRLLLSSGQYCLVYDVSKSPSLIKRIPLMPSSITKITGEVVAVTCSPFSKSLVAVGCSGGLISLIDMEKEKRYVLLFCYSDESCE